MIMIDLCLRYVQGWAFKVVMALFSGRTGRLQATEGAILRFYNCQKAGFKFSSKGIYDDGLLMAGC